MFWKIYAILFLVIILLGITMGAMNEELLTKWELLDMPISIIGIMGVVAFAFKKSIFKLSFWKIWCILFPLWGIIFSAFSSNAIFENASAVVIIISSLFCLPGYLALFLYGYRSKEIWSK